jgi:glucose/arabinose dehydrogenase
MKIAILLASVATSLLVGLGTAQEEDWTCLVPPTPRFTPQMAPGYKATLLMTGLNHPRSIIFDPIGMLLVLEKGSGVRRIEVMESFGKVCIVKTKQILSKPEVS